MTPVVLKPGMALWPGRLDLAEQRTLLDDVFLRVQDAPFYRPTMPRSGTPFSVQMTNFGSLGWISDQSGYRYEKVHPLTGASWPPIPSILIALWSEISGYGAPPEACLVNLYDASARMGLHQDKDEDAPEAPVLSVSLGD